MKKVYCMVVMAVLIMTTTMRTFAQSTSQSETVNLLDYNEEYSKNKGQILQNKVYDLQSTVRSLSTVKRQAKSIITEGDNTKVGTITLEYQTQIVGGRPQFAYSSCSLSHPNLDTYWALEESTVSFSGDCIKVYFSFVFGPFQDYAWVYFYPS